MRPRIGPPPPPLHASWKEKILSAIPFGLGVSKPRHFRDMARVLLENRDNLPYALRILRHGVCDGCSLGPRGLTDDVIPGSVHLCLTRLKLLRLNTAGALDPAALSDISRLEGLTGAELKKLGRLGFPMVRRQGMRGFERISWDEALDLAAEAFRRTPGDRTAWFITSRGVYNEAFYVFQKAARLLGSPHVDGSARLCHAPTLYGLGDLLGSGAPNCSLSDFIGTDLLVLWGTNLANNQPVALKYIAEARKRGTRVAIINPYREKGLLKYWIPSLPLSAVFGTRISDDFFQVKVGGDIAFTNGVLKALDARGGLDSEFLRRNASGVEEGLEKVRSTPWERLETGSGVSRGEMERFADLYREARTAVFVYSMGVTQHVMGVENVRSVGVLALARGMLGRPKCGIMAIRGHSGVQGSSEMGVAPDRLPGGTPVDADGAARWGEAWGSPVPATRGMPTPLQVEAMHRGEMDILYTVGGNLYETMPDPGFVREALGRVGLRIHQDIVVNTSALIPAPLVLLLPGATRYETPGGVTTTSTERRVRFSPEIPGPRIGEAKPEWWIPAAIARRVLPRGAELFPYEDTGDIRAEIERLVPLYEGIGALSREGDSFQWGGERLFADGFPKMPGGRARFWVQDLPSLDGEESASNGAFILTTRRGKQFNSIIHGPSDPLTGMAARTAAFLNAGDMLALEVSEGGPLLLRNELGEMLATAVSADIPRGTVQMLWPEGNALIGRRYDPISGEPDYNARVTVERVA